MVEERPLLFETAAFDIGNTGANVAIITLPVKVVVDKVLCFSRSAVANSFTVSCDSYNFTTQGAEDVGRIVVPDSTGAYRSRYDLAGRGVVLNAGEQILVQVDEAGDSGENAVVQVVAHYHPEYEGNQSLLVETA